LIWPSSFGVAFKDNLALVKLLLDHGVDIDADNGGGETPLMFAAIFGHYAIVEDDEDD